AIVRGPEVEACEIDRVVTGRVDARDGIYERHAAPRALAEFVGVVMDEPVRVDRAGHRRLALEDARPVERVGSAGLAGAGQRLDREEAGAGEALDGGGGAVGGAVVEQIDVNALLDQVNDDLLDDVRFVVRGDDRDNAEGARHAPAFYRSLRALPGEG